MSNVKCCLLVENDPEDQEIFIDAIHRIAANVGCYALTNGEEAIATMVDEDFVPDYIFINLTMSQTEGFEFLKKLRDMERFRSVPVIVFSLDTSDELIQKAKTLGVRAVHSKTRVGILPDILKKYLIDSVRASVL